MGKNGSISGDSPKAFEINDLRLIPSFPLRALGPPGGAGNRITGNFSLKILNYV